MIEEKFIGYVAIFTKIDDKKYIVEFPDLPGCYSQGDSLEEAVCMAQKALAIYYQEKRGKLPIATDIAIIQKANTNAIAQMIVIDHIVKPLRTVKKTLTIPEWLNALSEKYQVNFSQILKAALINHLNNLDSISENDKRMLNG